MVLYFAYGSNMCFREMKDTCPSAKFRCIALLPDHRLAFTRKSIRRCCGVADAVANPGREVWGVVYEIADVELGDLDSREDYREGRPQDQNSYNRCQVEVHRNGDVKDSTPIWIYFANRKKSPPLPSREYRDLLVGGARHWKLPPRYVKMLEEIQVSK